MLRSIAYMQKYHQLLIFFALAACPIHYLSNLLGKAAQGLDQFLEDYTALSLIVIMVKKKDKIGPAIINRT